ncbi:MAG: thiamine phosphate synthase [Cyanobacteria bacterium J06639_1]
MLPFDLLLVSDRASAQRARRTVVETIALALRDLDARRVAVLLRDKQSPVADVAAQLEALASITARAGALLLVHSYPDLAISLNLAGVHVASRVDVQDARDRLAPGMLLGASRHVDDPLDASDLGLADYATISPIFSPTSKPGDRRPTLGLAGLSACVRRSVRPLVALGGIQPDRIRDLMLAGAEAIAISGAVMQAPDPAQIVRDCLTEIEKGRSLSDTEC